MSQRSQSQLTGGANGNHYAILSKRVQNRDKLPGDPNLYDGQPPRVDYYDVFYFETRVRDMLEEYMQPLQESIHNDKEASI